MKHLYQYFMKHLYQYFIKNQSNDFQPQPNITRVKQIKPESKKQIHRQIEPVCFDIMEMIGNEYTFIKQKQKTKQKMSLVLDQINQIDEYGFKCYEWGMSIITNDDWYEWSTNCVDVSEWYEEHPNPYIKMEIDYEWSMMNQPTFMIELIEAFDQKQTMFNDYCEKEAIVLN